MAVRLDGTVVGMDLNGTERGRNRNFTSQADWDFAAAEDGFANLAGTGDTVYAVHVTRLTVAVTVATPGSAVNTIDYSWDGGSFRAGLSLPSADRRGGPLANLPYALTAARIANLPAILDAARAADPGNTVQFARALRQTQVGGRALELLWLVHLAPRPRRSATSNMRRLSSRSAPMPPSLR